MPELKKCKIHYAPESQQDLDEIWDYIVSELQNRTAAIHVVDRIMDTVDQLAYHPLMGESLSATADVDGDYRFLVSGSYRIFYRVVGQDVYVDRILYGRREYLRILFGDKGE